MTAAVGGHEYRYAFSLVLSDELSDMRIHSEILECDGKFVYSRHGAGIRLGVQKFASFSYDWHVLFLPSYQEVRIQYNVDCFRKWLAGILVLSPNPKLMQSEISETVQWLTRDCSNVVAWIGHLLAARPKSYESIEKYLKGFWDDFHTVSYELIGSKNKRLKLAFNNGASRDL